MAHLGAREHTGHAKEAAAGAATGTATAGSRHTGSRGPSAKQVAAPSPYGAGSAQPAVQRRRSGLLASKKLSALGSNGSSNATASCDRARIGTPSGTEACPGAGDSAEKASESLWPPAAPASPGAELDNGRATPGELVEPGSHHLAKKLQEQTHMFWESARRKDQELLSEEKLYAVLLGEFRALQAEQSEHNAVCARQEKCCQEAEDGLSKAREEVRALRKDGCERVRRHTSDMETLSSKLINAQSRAREIQTGSDNMLEELAESHRHLQDQEQRAAKAAELEARWHLEAQTAHASAEVLLEGERQILREELAHMQEELQTAQDRADKEEMAYRCEAVELVAMKSVEAATVARVQALQDEASSADAARAAECKEAEEVKRLSTILLRLEAQYAAESSEARAERETVCADLDRMQAALSDARTELVQGVEREAEFRAELQRVEVERRVESTAATKLLNEAQEAQLEVMQVGTQYSHAAQRVAELTSELANVHQSEALEKRCWIASHRSLERAEEQALANQAKRWRDELAAQESSMQGTVAMARRDSAEADAQYRLAANKESELTAALEQREERLGVSAHEIQLAESRLGALEATLASEYGAAHASLSKVESEMDASRTVLHSELSAAHDATAAARETEKQLAAELQAGTATCAGLQQQICTLRTQLERVQDTSKAHVEQNSELTSELTSARNDATRHGQAATEFRAELVATRRELAKLRYAERDMARAAEEGDAAKAKLAKVQRGRELAETDLKEARKRQAALEKQVRDLQGRLSAERLSRHDRDSSLRRDSSADAWLYCDPHGFFPAGSGPGSMGDPSPGGAAGRPPVAMAVPHVGKPKSADSMPVLRSGSDPPKPTEGSLRSMNSSERSSPGSARPGMGRSQSLGAFGVERAGAGLADMGCDLVETPSGSPTGERLPAALQGGALGVLRASPHHGSGSPPPLPSHPAPRMGWAAHARTSGRGRDLGNK